MTSSARRLYLTVVVKLLFLIGLGALALVFLTSLGGRGEDADQAADPWRIDVDWSSMKPGEYRTLKWPSGRLIGIYRRQPETVSRLRRQQVGSPQAQPNSLWRSSHPEIFVFFPYETRRGCRVTLDATRQTFVDACFGARFDTTGRLLPGEGVSGQDPLRIPAYELTGERRLRLLPPGGGA